MEKDLAALCKLSDFLEREKTVKDSERNLNIFFLTQVNRCFCLLSRNLGYAIQKIVLVLVRALRVVGL